MHYAGVDPSTNTGIVILNKKFEVVYRNCIHKKIDPDFKTNIWAKLNVILELIQDIINVLQEYNIKTVSVESLSYMSKGNQVDLQVALGYMLRNKLRQNGIKVIDITPNQLKKYATGNGRANKKEVLKAANEQGFITKNDNESDAYFLARMGIEL